MEQHEIVGIAERAVLRYSFVKLAAASLASSSQSVEEIERVMNRLPEELRITAIPGLKPEWSDLFAAELEAAALRLSEDVLAMVRMLRA